MAATFERVRRNFNGRIEEPVRKHLRNVYACLSLSTGAAAVGACISVHTQLLTAGFLSLIASLILLLVLQFTPPNGKNNNLRLGYLLGFAFFAGICVGPLVSFAVEINPSIIVSALIGTVLIFCCFTLSVLFAPKGYWLFIGAPLSTLLSTLALLSLGNIFFASTWLFQVNIYFELLAMCGFVIYDTTIIMEKCRMNDRDFIRHTLDLFIDIISIFKRLLAILIEKERNSKSRSKNK
ncbi:hypothetical protein RUM43_005251 [Polyplax serrata]|uniref:Bax inhibitor 1 n=1 Tax=Polyplax serrata TaxID=468196 RepID=A0AAN8PIP2_POLSC